MNRQPDQLVQATTQLLVGLVGAWVTAKFTGHPVLAAIAGVAVPLAIQRPIANTLVELGF